MHFFLGLKSNASPINLKAKSLQWYKYWFKTVCLLKIISPKFIDFKNGLRPLLDLVSTFRRLGRINIYKIKNIVKFVSSIHYIYCNSRFHYQPSNMFVSTWRVVCFIMFVLSFELLQTVSACTLWQTKGFYKYPID